MAPPYQFGYAPPTQQYTGLSYGYGFPQHYAGFNNPLFADPGLAYTPSVGPHARLSGHLDTPPVGSHAQLARSYGTLPYAQSPGGGRLGGTPSPNRRGRVNAEGGRMGTEDGENDVVGGVLLRDNGGNN